MNEVLRAHGAESGGDLGHEASSDGLLHASNATDELGHVSPGAVLEDEEYAALFLDDVVQLYDVVVAAAPQHADLGLERLAQLAVELFQLYLLHGHLGARGDVSRAPHHRERAPADLLLHLPLPDDPRSGDGRRGGRVGRRGEAAASASMLATQRRFSRELTCLARRLSRAGGRRARVDASREGSRAGGGRSRTRRTFGKRRWRLTASTDSALRSRASCFQPRDLSGDSVWIFQADDRVVLAPTIQSSSGRRLIYARRLQ